MAAGGNVARRDEIHRKPGAPHGPIGGKYQPEIVKPCALGLCRPGPVRGIVEHDCHRRARLVHLAQLFQVICRLPRFGQRRGGPVVGRQQPRMHLFLRKGRLPPPEIADNLGPMGHRLDRPEPDHAGKRGRVIGGPVHRAGLLFHHPPPAPADSPVQVVVKRLHVRIALLQKGGFVASSASSRSDRNPIG